jgi:hypothetical protein
MTKSHNERCRHCKESVRNLLSARFGVVEVNWDLGLPCSMEDYKNRECGHCRHRQRETVRSHCPIADQAARRGELARLEGRRNRIAHGQCGEFFTPASEECVAADNEPACLQLDHRCEDGIEIVFGARMQNMKLTPHHAPRDFTSHRGITYAPPY